MLPPELIAVILASPENRFNIGFVARAMVCNGVTDLRIAGSTLQEIPPEARKTGAAAVEILDRARFYPSVREAVADCSTVVGFTRRSFDLPIATLSVLEWGGRGEESAPSVTQPTSATPGKTGLLFGRESTGLNREELRIADLLCSIPSAPGVSYNLGMAVAIALYEGVNRSGGGGDTAAGAREPEGPTAGEREALFDWVAEEIGEGEKGAEHIEALRALFRKSSPTRGEWRALFGLLKAISHRSIKNRGEG